MLGVVIFVAIVSFFTCMIFLTGGFTSVFLDRKLGRTKRFLPNFMKFLVSLLAASIMAFISLNACVYLMGWIFNRFLTL